MRGCACRLDWPPAGSGKRFMPRKSLRGISHNLSCVQTISQPLRKLENDYRDFTERHYMDILQKAKERYRFAFFGDAGDDPHVLWRHDLDASVHRALRLAEIEKDCGVHGTYFVRLHSEFYNLLEGAVYDRIRGIIKMGHRLGLHFEGEFYGGISDAAELERLMLREKKLLEDWFGVRVGAFSFHNPDGGGGGGGFWTWVWTLWEMPET